VTIEQISQRDLRLRSREIMDAVEHGTTFTVTRDGHEIGQLVPKRQRKTFVTREEFVGAFRGAPAIDAEQFWADIDRHTDPYGDDPFER
jgi:antitoxin (DNA-binding transcriptional repressor) of toxin-antitoxin stability system